jgi:endonuclease/exonuclease/phosphatase family metal-dependent hydrolase
MTGGDKIKLNKQKSQNKLDNIIKEIIKNDSDIIFIQEICKWSSRTGGYNQVSYLINKLKENNNNQYKYYCYASYHKVKFIPVLRLKKLEGKVDMGNMIISKYPIENAMRYQLAIRKDTSPLERFFDLRRNALTCEIKISENKSSNIFLLNTHLAAFALDNTKNLQMNKIFKLMTNARDKGNDIIFGGDLNTVPPGCLKTVGYEDRAHVEDFLVDLSASSEWIQTFLLNFNSDFNEEEYKAVRGEYSTKWKTTKMLLSYQKSVGTHGNRGDYNRKLDFIFSNLTKNKKHDFEELRYKKWLSDHLPIGITYTYEN